MVMASTGTYLSAGVFKGKIIQSYNNLSLCVLIYYLAILTTEKFCFDMCSCSMMSVSIFNWYNYAHVALMPNETRPKKPQAFQQGQKTGSPISPSILDVGHLCTFSMRGIKQTIPDLFQLFLRNIFTKKYFSLAFVGRDPPPVIS